MVVVNRVRRIIRKIDPWTALKISFVLNFIIALSMVLGLVILWILLVNAGIPQELEGIARKVALLDDTSSIVDNSEELFSSVVFLAIVYMLGQTAITTVTVIFYILISDIVGGLEVVVLEESYPEDIKESDETKKTEQNKETVLMTMSKTIKNLRSQIDTKAESEEIPKIEEQKPDSNQ